MKRKLRELEFVDSKGFKGAVDKEKKDIYNEIHNKIDILNISIDKKGHQDGTNELEGTRESRKGKNTKNRFYR